MIARRAAGALCLGLTIVVGIAGCLGPVERPAADFTACPDGAAGRLDFVFVSTSREVRGFRVVHAAWDFGDGSQAEGTGPLTHRFAQPGTYAVSLTVTDQRGVAGTVTRHLVVEPAASVDPTWRLTLDPPTVTGVVGNRSSWTLAEVVVRVRFLDPDGVRLGERRCVVRGVEPGERVRFALELEASEFAPRVFFALVDVESFQAECPRASAGP